MLLNIYRTTHTGSDHLCWWWQQLTKTRHLGWNVICGSMPNMAQNKRMKQKERNGNNLQNPIFTHAHTQIDVSFCDHWINTSSVTELPVLRHFPTNRLNTLCSVDTHTYTRARPCAPSSPLCVLPPPSFSLPYFPPCCLVPFLPPSSFLLCSSVKSFNSPII